MKLPSVLELVKSKRSASFVCFKDDELWYEIDGFTFPVPVDDTAGAVFGKEEPALIMMRWIRKHIEFLKQSLSEEKSE